MIHCIMNMIRNKLTCTTIKHKLKCTTIKHKLKCTAIKSKIKSDTPNNFRYFVVSSTAGFGVRRNTCLNLEDTFNNVGSSSCVSSTVMLQYFPNDSSISFGDTLQGGPVYGTPVIEGVLIKCFPPACNISYINRAIIRSSGRM